MYITIKVTAESCVNAVSRSDGLNGAHNPGTQCLHTESIHFDKCAAWVQLPECCTCMLTLPMKFKLGFALLNLELLPIW